MAIDFVKKEKSQKRLIIIFTVVMVVVFIVVWQGFLVQETPYLPDEVFLSPAEEVKINFEIFEKVKEFQSFPEPIVAEKGRENPFLPY